MINLVQNPSEACNKYNLEGIGKIPHQTKHISLNYAQLGVKSTRSIQQV